MQKYIIRRYNYNYYKIFKKYLKLLRHVSDLKGYIVREFYTLYKAH